MQLRGKTVLITGAAGFIGASLAMELLQSQPGIKLIGLDNLNHYYNVRLKEYRLREIEGTGNSGWTFLRGSIADRNLVEFIFKEYRPDIVVNLAAQAGVRYSITNPDTYIESNIIGFYNLLEACRHSRDGGALGVEHLVYASSSSVYGDNQNIPFSTEDKTDCPVSLYAATKKSNELMAYAYSKLYDIPATGLRFFTVYGPAGRPDMACFSFTEKLRRGETIQLFNYGNCERDFTYIDDIVEGVKRIICRPPERMFNGKHVTPHAVYNIGNSKPENLFTFVETLHEELIETGVLPPNHDLKLHLELVPSQPGDVKVTFADTSELERRFGYRPNTSLRDGLRKFAEWYYSFQYDTKP